MQQPGTVHVTTTPIEIKLDPKRRYSFKNTAIADDAGTPSTSVILVNENGNLFTPLYASGPGRYWFKPGEGLNHPGGPSSIWVRTDAGTCKFAVAPDWKDAS